MVGVQDVHSVTAKQMQWLRKGGRKRLHELFKEMEERLQRLGLFVPKLDEGEMLEYAAEKCSVGDYVVLPGKRIFRRTEDGLPEASPADIVELTIL